MSKRKHYYPITDLPGEEWRDVVGYDGYYQVSNMGRVKGLARYDCRGRWFGERLLRPSMNERVKTSIEGKKLYVGVPGLVADAFLRERLANEKVAHKNGDTKDHRAENLCIVKFRRWKTPSEQPNTNRLLTEGKRICQRCKEVKPEDQFYKLAKKKHYFCKTCSPEVTRRYDIFRRMIIHAPQ